MSPLQIWLVIATFLIVMPIVRALYILVRIFSLCAYFRVDLIEIISRDDHELLFKELGRKVVEQAYLFSHRGLRLLARAGDFEEKDECRQKFDLMREADLIWVPKRQSISFQITAFTLDIPFDHPEDAQKWRDLNKEIAAYIPRAVEALRIIDRYM